jgi:ribonucleoside-diphosphate reductase alpha chain
MEAALLPADSEAGFQFQDDGWGAIERVEEPETDPLDDQMGPWAYKQYLDKYSWKDENEEPTEVWPDTAYRVVRHELGALGYTDHDPEFQSLVRLITERKLLPGGRKLAQAGRQYHQTNNCFLYRCVDSREGWAELSYKAILALSSGGGIGVVYSDIRPNGSHITKTGGFATGPLTPANMVNDAARRIMGGGMRRSAIWGGLHWNHPDIFDWIVEKDWLDDIRAAKKKAAEEGKDQDVMAPLDMTNISVILDTEFFEAYDDETHPRHELAHKVYWTATAHMVAHGEPGFSIDTGDNEGENLRNACTEITSADDSDVCNLGSVNMARIKTLDEFREVVRLATLLLLAGTVYSDIPHSEIKATREKNRRLGLGLMGLHEWLLVRGYRYEMVPELQEWLAVYAEATEVAGEWADKHHLSRPIKTRAVAPTGTIGIIAETTTGTEPLFCVAYKRRFLDMDQRWKFQYVIDPIAHELIEEKGVDPDTIEDAYSLSYNVERRISFQADLQGYVDHAIASTINLPYPITDEAEVRDFGETLMKYLPRLRGVTCYPDGARAGQPLEAVPYEIAVGKTGVTFDDNRDNACAGGACGV